jgi:hypothetical protein
LHQTFNLVFCGFSVYCSLPPFLSPNHPPLSPLSLSVQAARAGECSDSLFIL